MRSVLGSRASIGGVLGSGRGGAAAAWWLSGGVSAANAIAVYQPIGAASLAASYTNLANPGTYNAAPGVAPTWAAVTGWTFNGSTQYLTTGVVPVNNQTWSIIGRFASATVSGGTVIGGGNSGLTTAILLQPRRAANSAVGYFSGQFLQVAPAMSDGVMAVAGIYGYRNATVESGTIPSAPGSFSACFVGAANNGGSPLLYFSGSIQSIAIYNTTLSAAQVAAISSAMSALTG